MFLYFKISFIFIEQCSIHITDYIPIFINYNLNSIVDENDIGALKIKLLTIQSNVIIAILVFLLLLLNIALGGHINNFIYYSLSALRVTTIAIAIKERTNTKNLEMIEISKIL